MSYLRFTGKDYFKRSWTMLTRSKGWLKSVLIVFCVSFIPIAGSIWVLGYAMEWARLTAWGVDSSPKQKDVRIGECFASGWCAFLVAFCYVLVYALCGLGIYQLSSAISSGLGTFALLVLIVLAAFFVPLVYVACLRAVLYRKATAGLSFGRVWEMVSRDAKGFRHLGWMQIAWHAVFFLLMIICIVPFVAMLMGSGIVQSMYRGAIPYLHHLMRYYTPYLVFDYMAQQFSNNLLELVTCNACGLWMMQFDVPHWGRASDPLPYSATGSAGSAGGLPPTSGLATYVPDGDPSAPSYVPGPQGSSHPGVPDDHLLS
jgi:hypothetical protein